MRQSKTWGIILTVLGAAVGIWANGMFRGAAGQQYTWTPPFTGYEAATITGGVVAVALIIIGLLYLTGKPKS